MRGIICQAAIRDLRVQSILLLSRFSLQALTLTPGPAPYCREESSPAADHVRCPSRQDRGDLRRSLGRCRRLLMHPSHFRPSLPGPRRRPRPLETNPSSRLFRPSLPGPRRRPPHPLRRTHRLDCPVASISCDRCLLCTLLQDRVQIKPLRHVEVVQASQTVV